MRHGTTLYCYSDAAGKMGEMETDKRGKWSSEQGEEKGGRDCFSECIGWTFPEEKGFTIDWNRSEEEIRSVFVGWNENGEYLWDSHTFRSFSCTIIPLDDRLSWNGMSIRSMILGGPSVSGNVKRDSYTRHGASDYLWGIPTRPPSMLVLP